MASVYLQSGKMQQLSFPDILVPKKEQCNHPDFLYTWTDNGFMHVHKNLLCVCRKSAAAYLIGSLLTAPITNLSHRVIIKQTVPITIFNNIDSLSAHNAAHTQLFVHFCSTMII